MTVYHERQHDFYIMFENEYDPTSGPMYCTYDGARPVLRAHGWDRRAIRSQLVEVENFSRIPPRSMCAVCDVGIHTIDYLCDDCRT